MLKGNYGYENKFTDLQFGDKSKRIAKMMKTFAEVQDQSIFLASEGRS